VNNGTFEKLFGEALQAVANVEGHLTDREIRCLTLLGATPCAEGVILEIGSFKGRSTIVLAKSAAGTGESKIVAVDPLTSPSKTDPDLRGKASGWSDFQMNLKNAGVEDAVEFHRQRSSELAGKWDASRKIRLLWIDGDHTHAGAKLDFDLFRPFLANGAIVAMHDVLHAPGGPARVFAEDILLSPNFGAFGFSGSIAWAQYFASPEVSVPFRSGKVKFHRKMTRLIALSAFDSEPHGWNKLRYKLARFRIPHGDVQLEEFNRQISRAG
jgi:predicted O-methyltransferase YrrM